MSTRAYKTKKQNTGAGYSYEHRKSSNFFTQEIQKNDKWNPIHPKFKEYLRIKIMKVVIYLKEIHDKLLTEVFIKSKADTGHQALSA